MQESEVDARLFVCGGSLSEFLKDDAIVTVLTALNRITKPEHAEMLLTMYGVGPDEHINRIRLRGVRDRENANHYVDIWHWTSCVTSELALHHLAATVNPEFFEKLMQIARRVNDDRLEGVAFEGYFHTLVRCRRLISVHYCKYAYVDHGVDDLEHIMSQELGSIHWKELMLIVCEGENRNECVAEMESWAANPSKMEYWIPATSLCGTIDAVAKWTFPDNLVRFCFLQVTKATTHKCNSAVLRELAQPFMDNNLQVCYMVLTPDEETRRNFQWSTEQITTQEVLDHIPMYVAHFQVLAREHQQNL